MEADANKRVILIIALLSSFLTPFMGSSINIALPAIGKAFSLNAILLNWVATSYLLATAVFLLPMGRIADIYGRKKVFTCGITLFTLCSFLTAFAPNIFVFLFIRVLQGIGSSMMFSTGIAILTSIYPPGERGHVLGLSAAAVYVGLSAGPFLGGVLTEHFGWPSIFLVNVPIGLAVLYLGAMKLKGEWAEAKGEAFDLSGAVIYGLMLICAIYGFSILPQHVGIGLIAVGIVLGIVFVAWEMRSKSPIVDMKLFRSNRVFAFSNLAALIQYSATFSTGFLLSLYLQYIKGLSPQNAGMILLSQPLIMAFVSPFAGKLSDKVEPRIVSSIGMMLTSLGLLSFSFLHEDTTIIVIVTTLIIFGLGFSLFASPNTNAVMGSVEKKTYGVASGVLATMRLTGQMMSMGIVLLLFSLYLGKVQITPHYYPMFLQSVNTAFFLFFLFSCVGIWASLVRGKIH